MAGPRALTDLPLGRFEEFVVDLGAPRFAGRNLRRWVYQQRARDFEVMTDLSLAIRRQLQGRTRIRRVAVARRRHDASGTVAFVLRLHDGNLIETVLIPEEERRTVCVSTQVGCPVACVFCASGLNGLRRNLSPGEIVEQVMLVQESLPADQPVTNVVVMGIGEPTMNLTALEQALATWNHPDGLGLGARRITISTVGYPRRIERLAALGKEFGLAISLHAPRQDLREQLVPGVRGVGLAELLAAARHYFQHTGRRVTFEYVLLAGVNDGQREARELSSLLAGLPCIVNLIPVNPVDGLPWCRPAAGVVDRFRQELLLQGLQVTRRQTRGDGIAAACGQLRLRELERDRPVAESS